MSNDEDDERMDRARRIRRMREGRRDPEAEESVADPNDDRPGDGDEPEREQVADEQADTDQADDAATADETTKSDEGDSQGTNGPAGDAVPEPTDAGDEQPVAADETESVGTDPADDAGSSSGDERAVNAESEAAWFDGEDAAASDAGEAPEDVTAAASTVESEGDTEPDREMPNDTEPTDDERSVASSGAAETASAAASAAAAFEKDEAAITDATDAETGSDDDTVTRAPGTAEPDVQAEATQEEEIRVLEFRLGDERYCLDIMHVEEIVKKETITRVPNTPEHVHGVVDLRGQITTILDPKVALDIESETEEQLLIVFDGETFEDQGHAGWIVDEVRQVLPITKSEVKESPIDRAEIKGVIERDDDFVIWTEPQIALRDGEE